MEALGPVWQRAGEFGVLAFLLVIVITGGGFAMWRIGDRVFDVMSRYLERQTEAGDRMGEAVEKIGDMAAAIHKQNEQSAMVLAKHAETVSTVHGYVLRQHRAINKILGAVAEVAHDHSPRVKEYLEDARRAMEHD